MTQSGAGLVAGVEAAAAAPQRGQSSGLRIGRRPALPSGRAVVGGFLVAAATIGVFGAYTSAAAGPTTRYVVAARDLYPGDRVEAAALALVAITLPDAQRARAYDVVEPLVGTTVVEPLRAGELLQDGAVIATPASAGSRTISFAVDAARALSGRLKPGERVDVVATFGSGAEACTHLVADAVPVVTMGDASGSLVADGTLTVGLAVEDPAQELAIAHAASAGTMTLVRATGAQPMPAGDRRFCTPAGVPGGPVVTAATSDAVTPGPGPHGPITP